MKEFIFLILFLKLSIAQSPFLVDSWMIWNVGQGQWLTHIERDMCTHYDFGGEVFALKKIRPLFIKNCRDKKNQLYLSHADWDHYAFYNFILKNSQKVCWKIKPEEPLKKLSLDIPYCENSTTYPPLQSSNTKVLFYDQHEKNRNDTSTVLQVDQLLIPGDSPIKQEKKWIQNISMNNTINFLILGHHGSRTSTSDMLLQKLPHLKMAFATSRFKKYGHPHKQVIERLREHHLNVIKTEDWGTILIR